MYINIYLYIYTFFILISYSNFFINVRVLNQQTCVWRMHVDTALNLRIDDHTPCCSMKDMSIDLRTIKHTIFMNKPDSIPKVTNFLFFFSRNIHSKKALHREWRVNYLLLVCFQNKPICFASPSQTWVCMLTVNSLVLLWSIHNIAVCKYAL